MNPTLISWTLTYLTALAVIIVVDFWLGPTAEYLNAYEIVRRGLLPSLPQVSERFLVGAERFGRWLWPTAWVAFLVEAALLTCLFKGALAGFAAVLR